MPAELRMGAGAIALERAANGVLYLRSPETLGAYPTTLTDRLAHWAQTAPERTFLAKRLAGGAWRKVSFAQAHDAVRRLGQALLDLGASAERPVAILSENDIEHALLALAAQHIGSASAAVSPPYSLVSKDFVKLRYVTDLLTPSIIFVSSTLRYQNALAALAPQDATIVATENAAGLGGVTLFETLLAATPTKAVDEAHARVSPETTAKILFTSGSTGMPKGVINTHRMLCANMQMQLQVWPFLADEPPVIVDWLPWNHTFGGNSNFNIALYNGGTFYIDEGKPVGTAFQETVRNLREIAPTLYFGVPKAYEFLLAALRDDSSLTAHFFSRLKLMFYAGAAMAQDVWDGFPDLARAHDRAPVLMVTSLGATETAPMSIAAVRAAPRPGEIGAPAPGVEVKLVPSGSKLELRLRGPNITPGYWRRPDLSAAAFDEEGFYKMGDAVAFIDSQAPEKGLRFDGRIAEDFKLASGTWVNVAQVRAALLSACAPLIRDCVIAGHDRDDLRALLVPDLDACRAVCGALDQSASAADVLSHPTLRAQIAAALRDHAPPNAGSAQRVMAGLILQQPPSLDSGEITDKGSLNQALILERRAALVTALYARPSPETVILPDQPA